jgi:hypothetical protein
MGKLMMERKRAREKEGCKDDLNVSKENENKDVNEGMNWKRFASIHCINTLYKHSA